LNAQRVVIEMVEPGVSWVDCHKAAEGEILKALVKLGIVIDYPMDIEALTDMRMGAVFMPHGLGHLIGIDTHDVGGYLRGHPKRSRAPGLCD
jgi:Xaa-Pro dipeptidase